MGKAFESNEIAKAQLTGGNYATQLRVRAFDANGQLLPGYVSLDMAGFDSTGQFVAKEFKLSINSPLTERQSQHFSFFGTYGGLVTGFTGEKANIPRGRVLAPFEVQLNHGGPQLNIR